MAKLTERQKKNIVSAYAAGGVSQSTLAKKYGVSEETIRRVIKNDPTFLGKCGDIKKEAEQEAAQNLAKAITDRYKYADELLDDILLSVKQKISAAPLRDLMGAAKILQENFLEAGRDPGDQEDDKTFKVVICDNGHKD